MNEKQQFKKWLLIILALFFGAKLLGRMVRSVAEGWDELDLPDPHSPMTFNSAARRSKPVMAPRNGAYHGSDHGLAQQGAW